MCNSSQLIYEDKAKMHLAGLMIGNVISANLEDSRKSALAKKLKGDVCVLVGKMKMTVRFDRHNVTLLTRLQPKYKAMVKGSLDAMLQVSLGKGALTAFFEGDITFRGNPFFLMKMLPLIRVDVSSREGK